MSEKLRVVFEKGEAIRYVGHLDILRTFVRALRRADIPLKYSEGFNPHPLLTFILPMGVGVTSTCEIVDIVLREKMLTEKFIYDVNSALQPGGVRIISAEYTDTKMPIIEKAEYITEIISECDVSKDEIEEAFSLKEILVEKKSKRSITEINIAEHISDKEIISIDGNRIILRFIVSAGNTFNIKPTLAVSAFESVCPTLKPVSAKPCRTKFIFD